MDRFDMQSWFSRSREPEAVSREGTVDAMCLEKGPESGVSIVFSRLHLAR